MRPIKHTRALCVLALALALGACSDDDGPKEVNVSDSGGSGSISGATDAGVTTLQACADPPATAVPRPPSGELPCELLPPGFTR